MFFLSLVYLQLEEAEWVGLSIEEALQKAEDIQAARPVVTPKEIFTKQLVEKMQEQKGRSINIFVSQGYEVHFVPS